MFDYVFAVQIPLEEVREEWLKTEGPSHIHRIAEHYGIYEDLFGDAFFIPYVALNIKYKQKDNCYLPVHHGNVIKPVEVVFYRIQALLLLISSRL